VYSRQTDSGSPGQAAHRRVLLAVVNLRGCVARVSTNRIIIQLEVMPLSRTDVPGKRSLVRRFTRKSTRETARAPRASWDTAYWTAWRRRSAPPTWGREKSRRCGRRVYTTDARDSSRHPTSIRPTRPAHRIDPRNSSRGKSSGRSLPRAYIACTQVCARPARCGMSWKANVRPRPSGDAPRIRHDAKTRMPFGARAAVSSFKSREKK
jgi:hypothetical protein